MTEGFSFKEKEGLLYVTAPLLDGFEGLCHAFSTRVGGVSRGPFESLNFGMAPGEESSRVVENRRRLFRALRLPHGPLTTVCQVHSARVVAIRPPARRGATGEEADGMVTDCVEVPLAVFHADCPSIVLYDPGRRACGLAHAGREGVRGGLARALVEAMSKEFGSRPEDLFAALGPGIRACCYEVSPELARGWPEEALLEGPRGRPHIDLPRAILGQLEAAGLKASRIQDTGLCTACRTDLFFSYRAEGPGTGRLMTLVVLLPAVT